MAEDLIEKIKEAEQEAQRIIHEAEAKASHLLTEAQESRNRRVEDARRDGNRIVKEASERASRKADKEIAKLKKTERARIEAIWSHAQKNMDRAVECIVEGI
ncbi:MAG: hypothetical protein GTN81_03925 [Proteobacteria bacterium]|nr:hypothetical protein [Pseudomonadota bacterium]